MSSEETTGAVADEAMDEVLRRAAHAVTNARRDGSIHDDYAVARAVLKAAVGRGSAMDVLSVTMLVATGLSVPGSPGEVQG